YLMHLGITDSKLAQALVDQLGGNPLTLKLASEVVKKETVGPGGIADLTTRRYYFLSMQENLIQGQLYRRILAHIHNENVRKIAHPGLVLRRITPELIRDVLAVPCGVDLSEDTEAHRLYEELGREVSLVTIAHDGALEHRSDVRRVMLDMLWHDEPLKVRQ